MACVFFSLIASCDANEPLFPSVDAGADGSVDADGGIEERPPTTLKQTVMGLLDAVAQDTDSDSDNPDMSLWGLTQVGPGEPYIGRDDLKVGDATAAPIGEPSSLAYILQITDPHIVDEESPARLIDGDELVSVAYRTQEAWSCQFLEAAVRTGSAFAYYRPFDFALFTGDFIDNIQTNELAWFAQIMEGGVVNPDSGQDDDPLPGPNNDPHDPFIAQGFARNVPWYSSLGNHDDMVLGNGPLVDWLLADPIGDTTSSLSKAVVPTCLDAPWYETESKIPLRCYLPPKSQYMGTKVIPDPQRAFISRSDWLAAHFGTATIPDGHGYTADNLGSGEADYVVQEPVSGVPLTLISLNMVSQSGEGGTFGEAKRAWLADKLERAKAGGRIVVIASHHTAGSVANADEKNALVALLNQYPNVVLHIGGHTHVNRVTPHPAPQGMPRENGYWEIETSALIDWPQQSRLVEIVDNRDGTGSIYSTMIDYQIPADMKLVEGGRFYALFDIQEGGGDAGTGAPSDRNVILRFAWPKEIADTLAGLGHREVESLNFEGSRR
jgi:3',5'-cyclic AMP phosphodiesterase CpdA